MTHWHKIDSASIVESTRFRPKSQKWSDRQLLFRVSNFTNDEDTSVAKILLRNLVCSFGPFSILRQCAHVHSQHTERPHLHGTRINHPPQIQQKCPPTCAFRKRVTHQPPIHPFPKWVIILGFQQSHPFSSPPTQAQPDWASPNRARPPPNSSPQNCKLTNAPILPLLPHKRSPIGFPPSELALPQIRPLRIVSLQTQRNRNSYKCWILCGGSVSFVRKVSYQRSIIPDRGEQRREHVAKLSCKLDVDSMDSRAKVVIDSQREADNGIASDLIGLVLGVVDDFLEFCRSQR